ncbi:MAG: hypothetical protein ACRDAP_00830, partial [Shewanella sp.]
SENKCQKVGILARIICIAKESLPFGIYSRICQLLSVATSGISSWCGDYKKTDYFRQMIASAMPRAQLTTTSVITQTSATTSSSSALMQVLMAPQAVSTLVPQSRRRSPALSATQTVVTRRPPPASPSSAAVVSSAQGMTQPTFSDVVASPSFMPAVTTTSSSSALMQALMAPQAASRHMQPFMPQSTMAGFSAFSGAPATVVRHQVQPTLPTSAPMIPFTQASFTQGAMQPTSATPFTWSAPAATITSPSQVPQLALPSHSTVPAFVPQSPALTHPAPSALPAIAARQAALPVAISTVQPGVVPAAAPLVFTTPAVSSSAPAPQLAPVLPPFMQGTPEDETEENQDAQPSSSSALGFGWLSNEDFGDVSDITKADLLALLTDGSQSRILEGNEDDVLTDGE